VSGFDPSSARLRDWVFMFDFEKLTIHYNYLIGWNDRPSDPLAVELTIITALPAINSRGAVPQNLLSWLLSRLSPKTRPW
jgi:hypothetical protein